MVVRGRFVRWRRRAGLSLSSGCNFSSSRTREIRDLSIIDKSSDGSIHYKLEVKNLPELVNTQPPAISRASFDFHSGWVWSVENTVESDAATRYRMKVTLSDMNYRDLCSSAPGGPYGIQNRPIEKKEFSSTSRFRTEFLAAM